MSEITKAKSRTKKFYYPQKSNKSGLDLNSKGFLCSCNNNEKQCIKEAYNILNLYADKLYGCEKEETTPNAPEGEDDDIEGSLKKEVLLLKKRPWRFKMVESGAKNFLFIKTTLDNPVEIAQKILEEIYETKNQQTRFVLRLVPIEVITKAYVEDIVKAFEGLCQKYFTESPKTYSIVFNHRNNNSVSRDEVIKAVAEKVAAVRDDHKVSLKEAQISIIIEVIKGFALIGVVPDYIKFKKYNLLAFGGDEDKESKEMEDKEEK